MNRNKRLLEKRRKQIGMLFDIKKSNNISSKRAKIEISDAFTISIETVTKELTKYNKDKLRKAIRLMSA